MSAHNIQISVLKKKITLNYPKSAAMGLFCYGLKNEFETTVVNEPSVFEPLKFYSTQARMQKELEGANASPHWANYFKIMHFSAKN